MGCLLYFLSLNFVSHSKFFFAEELKWEYRNATTDMNFGDYDKLLEWSKTFRFTSVKTEKFQIDDHNFAVFFLDPCSGNYCTSVYIFREDHKGWQRIVYSRNALVGGAALMNIDNDSRKVIFKTTSGSIGVLTFDRLLE